jgi:chromosomal replication initiation ATPase DnaA
MEPIRNRIKKLRTLVNHEREKLNIFVVTQNNILENINKEIIELRNSLEIKEISSKEKNQSKKLYNKIIEIVFLYYNIDYLKAISSRKDKYSRIKQICLFLAKKYTCLTHVELLGNLNYKNQSMVNYSIRKVRDELSVNKYLQIEIEELKKLIENV